MIILPWPPKELSPNSRGHWSKKAKAVRSARASAGWIIKASGIKIVGDGFIYLQIVFNPPSKRRYDLDNCVARCKGMFDGIADGLGVDDSRFRFGFEFGDAVKDGRVTVEIKQ